MTMALIQHIELGSAASSISFSSIAGTFTDLMILTSTRNSNSSTFEDLRITFNGSGSGYSARTLAGNGSSTSSYSESGSSIQFSITSPAANSTSNTFENTAIYIPNYAGSANKSVSIDHVWEQNATSAGQKITAALWSNTAAITSVTLTAGVGNLVAGSSATLYGITKGSDGQTTVS